MKITCQYLNMRFVELCVILLGIIHPLSVFASTKADQKVEADVYDFDTLSVPKVFNDHMVLQREQPVKIWGRTKHNQEVKIQFRGLTFISKADSLGRWHITMPPMGAGGPFVMAIISGKKRKIFIDIFVGDVWLAAGQSNMAFRFKYSNEEDKKKVLSGDDRLNIRTYEVAKVVEGGKLLNRADSCWALVDKNKIGDWSAVAFYFARALYKANNIPIGIINCSQGASRIEAWMSPGAIEAVTKTYAVPKIAFKDIRKHYRNPSVLYQSMLKKIIPYSIKGVIWYQGESNGKEAESYKLLLPALIKSWREDWEQEHLPFLFAQLPAYEPSKDKKEDSWALFREVQAEIDKSVENTGMVVLIDVGERDNIHPKNKRVVGERFADLARAKVDNENIPYSGPTVKKVKYRNRKAVISFHYAKGGLVGSNKPLQGFEIKGDNGTWYKAEVKTKRNKVIVWNQEVKKLQGVRYGWANAPEVNLFNKEGLPAAPFRSKK